MMVGKSRYSLEQDKMTRTWLVYEGSTCILETPSHTDATSYVEKARERERRRGDDERNPIVYTTGGDDE